MTLVSEGNMLLSRGPKPKELAYLIKCPAEARGRCEVPKSAHWVIALFDSTMILFQVVIQVGIPAMHDLAAEHLTNRTWIGVMSIGRYPLRGVTNRCDSLAEELLCCLHIAFLTQA